ncbi:MAG: T9SS type A sorting domain-containing protein [Bacteroidetes bacterium]|nr:T9SS type A sorting domain-containing protein [Bacteroidota bacterium]
MKRLSCLVLFLLTAFSISTTFAQTPQYYNYNVTGNTNSFPFNIPGGKEVQVLFLPGDFAQPTPAPAGNITAVSFRLAANLGPYTYTNFYIKMGQTSLTTFDAGVWYSGPMTQVYQRASVSLGGNANEWMTINLDTPFNYNPAQSLVIEVNQCGAAGASGFSTGTTTLTGFRRNTSLTTSSCPFVWGQQSGTMPHMGVNISSGPVICTKYANTFCPLATYPVLPAITYFNCAAWIGDTLYVQAPTTAGAAATTIYRYTVGGTWTTGVPCPVGVTAASMNSVGGKLYLIGGGTTSATTGSNNVQRYDPATGTWTAMAPLPAALSAHGSVVWGDSVIYVVGGPYTGAATNLDVHYYRVAANTWGTISASLPSGQGRRTFALSLAAGNKIVMTCGFNTVYLKSTYIGTIGSNATQLTWAAGPDFPVALSRPSGFAYGNYSFLLGGDTNTTAVKNDKLWSYNATGGAWTQMITANPSPVSNIMNGVTIKCVNDTVKVFQPAGYNAASLGTNNLIITGCGTVTGVGNSSTIPKEYSLSQNYPNPFNPTTKIEFSLPKGEFVEMRLYDILGKEVAILAQGAFEPGKHTLDLNLSYLSSGTYFYRITAGQFTDTKKLMLTK